MEIDQKIRTKQRAKWVKNRTAHRMFWREKDWQELAAFIEACVYGEFKVDITQGITFMGVKHFKRT